MNPVLERVILGLFALLVIWRWVPDVQFNGTGGQGDSNQALTLMQIIAAKAAADLQLDHGIKPQ